MPALRIKLCRYHSHTYGEDGGYHSRNSAVTILFAGSARRLFTENRNYHLQIHIDADACIMPMNELSKAKQGWGNVNSDIGAKTCLQCEPSKFLREG